MPSDFPFGISAALKSQLFFVTKRLAKFFFFFFKWGWEEGGSIALWFLTNLKSCNWFTVAWGPSGYFSKN